METITLTNRTINDHLQNLVRSKFAKFRSEKSEQEFSCESYDKFCSSRLSTATNTKSTRPLIVLIPGQSAINVFSLRLCVCSLFSSFEFPRFKVQSSLSSSSSLNGFVFVHFMRSAQSVYAHFDSVRKIKRESKKKRRKIIIIGQPASRTSEEVVRFFIPDSSWCWIKIYSTGFMLCLVPQTHSACVFLLCIKKRHINDINSNNKVPTHLQRSSFFLCFSFFCLDVHFIGQHISTFFHPSIISFAA